MSVKIDNVCAAIDSLASFEYLRHSIIAISWSFAILGINHNLKALLDTT
jgi:hypothetical protein